MIAFGKAGTSLSLLSSRGVLTEAALILPPPFVGIFLTH
jgi:hypothetical protein